MDPTRSSTPAQGMDRFGLVQGLIDWFQVLVAPSRFFREQAEQEGLKAPLALILVYCGVLRLAAAPRMLRTTGPSLQTLGHTGLLLVGGLTVTIVLMFVGAGIVHGVCRLLSGRARYGGTFRAVTYAAAPVFALSIVSEFRYYFGPGGTPSVVGWLSLLLLGGIYSTLLLATGVLHIHRLSKAQSVAAALVPAVIAGAAVALTLLTFYTVNIRSHASRERLAQQLTRAWDTLSRSPRPMTALVGTWQQFGVPSSRRHVLTITSDGIYRKAGRFGTEVGRWSGTSRIHTTDTQSPPHFRADWDWWISSDGKLLTIWRSVGGRPAELMEFYERLR